MVPLFPSQHLTLACRFPPTVQCPAPPKASLLMCAVNTDFVSQLVWMTTIPIVLTGLIFLAMAIHTHRDPGRRLELSAKYTQLFLGM